MKAKKRPKAGTSKAAPKKMGRPSLFTAELAANICAQIAEGFSLRAICRAEGMPSAETVRRWLSENEDFCAQYTRAREEQADAYADEIIGIADNSELDANDKRVRIDARKWVASKLKPRKYGDKLELSGDMEVQHRTSDDIVGALNSIFGRYGLPQVAAGSAGAGASRSSGRRGAG